MTFEQALYDISYSNIIMYSSVVPSYSSSSDDEKANDEVINADDPRNQERIDRMLAE